MFGIKHHNLWRALCTGARASTQIRRSILAISNCWQNQREYLCHFTSLAWLKTINTKPQWPRERVINILLAHKLAAHANPVSVKTPLTRRSNVILQRFRSLTLPCSVPGTQCPLSTVTFFYVINVPCWAPARLQISQPPPCSICRKEGGVTGRPLSMSGTRTLRNNTEERA